MLPPGFRELDLRPYRERPGVERLALRFSGVWRLGAALMERLPQGRLRRLYLERFILPLAYGALNRRDFEAVWTIYFTRDMHMRFHGERIPGFQAEYFGRETAQAAYAEWLGEWGELERVPVAYAEGDGKVVVLTRQRGDGSTSGLPIDVELGQVYRLRGGLACEYIECRSWGEAIRLGGMAR